MLCSLLIENHSLLYFDGKHSLITQVQKPKSTKSTRVLNGIHHRLIVMVHCITIDSNAVSSNQKEDSFHRGDSIEIFSHRRRMVFCYDESKQVPSIRNDSHCAPSSGSVWKLPGIVLLGFDTDNQNSHS